MGQMAEKWPRVPERPSLSIEGGVDRQANRQRPRQP